MRAWRLYDARTAHFLTAAGACRLHTITHIHTQYHTATDAAVVTLFSHCTASGTPKCARLMTSHRIVDRPSTPMTAKLAIGPDDADIART